MSPLPKIAYLTGTYPRATDTFVRVEIEQLRELGVEVQPFSIRRPQGRELLDDATRRESARTVYVLASGSLRLAAALLAVAGRSPGRLLSALWLTLRVGAPGLRARLRQLAYLFEAAFLAREMERLGIDHLHDHLADSSASVALLASTLGRVSWSMTVHGPRIFFAPEQWALGEKVSHAAFTACISEYTRSQCMIFAPAEAWERLEIVRCGVDPARIQAAEVAVPDAPRFVCVGRLCPEKGQLLLVEAVHRLEQEGVAVELELVGDGPGREAIEAAITRLGLGKRVRLLGWQTSDQVFGRIREARALVLPSFAEGLPVVLMEAMATRRPVIATRIAGVPELVEHGVTGWLAAPSSLDDLVAALRAAATASPEVLLRMGRAGADRVAKHHDARQEARKLAALFSAHARRREI